MRCSRCRGAVAARVPSCSRRRCARVQRAARRAAHRLDVRRAEPRRSSALFTFLPIVINFYYAFTGGVQLYPSRAPVHRAARTSRRCSTAATTSIRRRCRKDLFWRAVCNTAQVRGAAGRADGASSALITALVLNRKILGRGFWRGVFFYPVLLSPVVVALIWKWILQREGVLNARARRRRRRRRSNGSTSAGWAFFWVRLRAASGRTWASTR